MRGVAFVCVAGLAVLILAAAPSPSVADDLIANGEFELWNGGSPVGWFGSGALIEGVGRTDSGATFTEPGSVQQSVDVAAGGSYSAIAWALGSDGSTVALELTWLDAGAGVLRTDRNPINSSGAWAPLSLGVTAPMRAARVRFEVVVTVTSGQSTTIDSASLLLTSAPPASTSTPLPPTATPTPATAVATATGTPAATNTATPTRTPTLPAGATASTTPSSPRTPTQTASPGGPPTATPTLAPPVSAYGGMLANGDFEILTGDGKPLYWAKFGGTMSASGLSYRGSWAAILSSDGVATRWLTQASPVEGGQWYRADTYARLASGSGEAFIRLSWYASNDGSGANLTQHDSGSATSGAWAYLTTGAVQAPAAAGSVRVRLMLRPDTDAVAAFDDARLVPTDPPPADTPTPSPAPSGATPTLVGAATAVSSPTRPPTATSTPRAGSPASSGGAGAGPGGFAIVPVAGPDSLRLSEVMSDALEAGRESAFEWVELVNVGSQMVNTAGWRLGDSAELDDLTAFEVPPGGFVVVAGPSAVFAAGVHVVRVADGSIGNGLNNAGDTLRLVSPAGIEVDALSYGDSTSVFDPAPPAPSAGETLGARSPGAEPDASNWAITLRPTPGEPNQFPAVIVAGSSTGSPGEERSSDSAPRAAAVQQASDSSPIPWIVLGGATAAGLLALGALTARWLPATWSRFRRGH